MTSAYFEKAARARKASALVSALDASGIRATAALVRTFDDHQWSLLTEAARRLSRDEDGREVNYSDPGPETIDAVIRLLERREALLRPVKVLGERSKSSQVVELRAVTLAMVKTPSPFERAEYARARRNAIRPGQVTS